MTYIDAHWDRNTDVVLVTERINGRRIVRELPPIYQFYYEDENGSHKATTGARVREVTSRRYRDFKRDLRSMQGRKTFEADHNVLFKTLKQNFPTPNPANLHVAFFDIEVDFDPIKGYSTPEDPFNPVTAVSVYCNWLDELFTLVVRPETLTDDEAQKIVDDFPNTVLCSEKELLMMFQDLIEDADVISGWNSETYDVPYMVNRTIKVLNKQATSGWCLWGFQPIRGISKDNFGRENLSFTIKGRLHIDYLDLYKKHTPKQMPTYKLDYVGEVEIGERKVQYEGTLYNLYRKDFKLFIEYNRQDTVLLDKLDKKLRYLDLANQIATANYVLMSSTMGTVAWVDQSIINEAHNRGMVVPTKEKEEEFDAKAAGAWVADPKQGLQDWVGAVDINSLYPSCIRLLNMSPETIVGQIRPDDTMTALEERIEKENLIKSVKGVRVPDWAAAWAGHFGTLEYNYVIDKTDNEITVDFNDDTIQQLTGAELYEIIFQEDSNLNISANGTLFRTDIDGLIPSLLKRWYTERKIMQKTASIWETLTESGISEDNHLYDSMLKEIPEETRQNRAGTWFPVDIKQAKENFIFWNMRQQVRKIQLNSLYGCLLNASSKFHDRRMGQSVTLTGRCITRHMTSKINEIITGEYDYTGDAIIYGDTDSAYFSVWNYFQKENIEFTWEKDDVTELYDQIAAMTNETFPEKMHDLFHSGVERGGIIQAGRELIGTRGLFVAKKRYAILIYDDKGIRRDRDGKSGKLKVMGMDIKRADSSKVIQEFLQDCAMYVLDGGNEDGLKEKIRNFRVIFKSLNSWEKGSPKSANKITEYTEEVEKKGSKNVRVPGHITASINWNKLCAAYGDRQSLRVTDGGRIVVCKLKPQNPMNMTSVAFPADELNLPSWFKKLPFDDDAMETGMVEQKLNNIFEILDWDLHIGEAAHSEVVNSMFSF